MATSTRVASAVGIAIPLLSVSGSQPPMQTPT
jgi:hypothetical protein